MSAEEDGAWFEPKRFGYGAGWPIAWQGWALLLGYFLVAGIATALIVWDREVGLIGAALLLVPATVALIVIAAHKTRGGWRWRWGERG